MKLRCGLRNRIGEKWSTLMAVPSACLSGTPVLKRTTSDTCFRSNIGACAWLRDEVSMPSRPPVRPAPNHGMLDCKEASLFCLLPTAIVQLARSARAPRRHANLASSPRLHAYSDQLLTPAAACCTAAHQLLACAHCHLTQRALRRPRQPARQRRRRREPLRLQGHRSAAGALRGSGRRRSRPWGPRRA